jgi:hypothetical protein
MTDPQPGITPAEEIQSVEPANPVEGGAQVQVTPGGTQVASPVEGPPPPAPPAEAPQPPPAAPEPAAPVAGAAAPPPPPPPAPETPLPATPPPAQAAAPAQPKVMDPEWPHVGYQGPQPWEADNPPALTQNHLMLSSGSAGDEVVELAAFLAYLGYGTSISAGQNPHAIYDSGVSDAVRAFCADYSVAEDPKVRQARTEDTVGPWIWEALVRAAHKKLADAGAGA